MLIVGDAGRDLVNTDQVFAVTIARMQDGSYAVVAFGAQVQTQLVKGSEQRCMAALDIIRRKWRNPETLDLRDIPDVGQRPNIHIAQPGQIPPPNGQGR